MAVVMVSVFSAVSANRAFLVKGPIKALETQGNIEVEYTAGENVSIVAHSESDFLKHITVRYRGGVLTINYQYDAKGKLPKATVYITAPDISSFKASDNSSIEVESAVVAESFSAVSSGNASIEFERTVTSRSSTVNVSGNSHMEFDTFAVSDQLTVNVSGNAELEIDGLSADIVKASTTGNSTAKIEGICSEVQLSASGNSDLKCGSLRASRGSSSAQENASLKCSIAKPTSLTHSGNSSLKNR